MKLIKKNIIALLIFALILPTLPSMCALAVDGNVTAVGGDVRFDFATDAEGFGDPIQGGELISAGGGILAAEKTGQELLINKPGVTINKSTHNYVRFRIKNGTTATIARFVLRGEDWSVTYQPRMTISTEDTDFQEYTIPLSYPDNGIDEYLNMRFDILGADAGEVEIDYIVFSQYETVPNEGMVTGISVGNYDIYGFHSGNDYYEVEQYTDEVEALDENSVNIEYSDAYEGALIKEINIQTVNKGKILDITVMNKEKTYSRSYRVVCRSIKRPARTTEIDISDFSIYHKKLHFQGTDIEKTGERVTVLAYNADTNEMKYLDVLTPNENGEFSDDIAFYDAEQEEVYYPMDVLFDIEGEEEPLKLSSVYFNDKKRESSIDGLKESEDGVLAYISDNEPLYTNLGVWVQMYHSQSESVKAAINRAAEAYRDKITSENVVEIANGSILAVMFDDMTVSEAVKYLREFDAEVKNIEVESYCFHTFNDSDAEWIVKNALANKPADGFKNIDDMYDAVRKSMLLRIVNDSAYMKLENILKNNTDILGNDLASLKEQTNTKIIDEAMRTIAVRAASAEFTSVSDLLNTLDDAITTAAATIKTQASQSTSGGGGGGGSSTTYEVPLKTPQSTENENDVSVEPNVNDNITKSIFGDMAGYEWAKDAVESLYDKGFVSGADERQYEPGRAVSREEFVKLICQAFHYGTSSKGTDFVDVKESDWFAPYVAKAVEVGVVEGISDNMFGVGASITREDMATLLYRALKLRGKKFDGIVTAFSDEKDISEYAKEAVNSLSGEKIVIGMGNGNFAPKATASRAEAAVIIYRCIEDR